MRDHPLRLPVYGILGVCSRFRVYKVKQDQFGTPVRGDRLNTTAKRALNRRTEGPAALPVCCSREIY